MANNFAVLGGGCFWCTEAIFQEVRGVTSVESGYSGGKIPNPSYEQVCTGRTGHAEVVKLIFDPSQISYSEILEIFFETHDPTTLNRQGNDTGPQYRSVIFYADEQQRSDALEVIERLENSGKYRREVVTALEPFEAFYPSEEYHRNYYRKNSDVPYCSYVISPKLEKFRKSGIKFLKV